MGKYFEDRNDDVAFIRCLDVMEKLLVKYGPQVLKRQKGLIISEAVGCDLVHRIQYLGKYFCQLGKM